MRRCFASSLRTVGRAAAANCSAFPQMPKRKWAELVAEGMLGRQNHVLSKHSALELGA